MNRVDGVIDYPYKRSNVKKSENVCGIQTPKEPYRVVQPDYRYVPEKGGLLFLPFCILIIYYIYMERVDSVSGGACTKYETPDRAIAAIGIIGR